jgi:hypothetical protein
MFVELSRKLWYECVASDRNYLKVAKVFPRSSSSGLYLYYYTQYLLKGGLKIF